MLLWKFKFQIYCNNTNINNMNLFTHKYSNIVKEIQIKINDFNVIIKLNVF